MVSAAGHEQNRWPGEICAGAGGNEHRRDRGDVRQVGAAVVGVVAEHHIPRGKGVPLTAADRRQQAGDAVAHRAQVHRNVGGVGHQGAAAVKHGTGEVEALADVHRAGALLQARAHLLGHRHEAVVVELQQGGIRGSCKLGSSSSASPGQGGLGCLLLQQQDTAAQQARLPAGLQQAGGGGIGDQRRPLQPLAQLELMALPVGHLQPAVVLPERTGGRC